MKNIAIIPARGGSKGLPRKNVRELCGKPLICHSIQHAADSEYIDDIYVSTDDDDIAEIAIQAGAKIIKRPSSLSLDESTSESALLHALQTLDDNIALVVFLQCTSPIRADNDIDNAILKLVESNADSLLSVVPSHKFLWQQGIDSAFSINYDFNSRPRRQDMQPQFQENGSIYVFKPWVLRNFNNRLGGNIALYEMSEDSAIDIDSEFDFHLAASVLENKEQIKDTGVKS